MSGVPALSPVAAGPEPAYREAVRLIGLFRRVMDPYFARHGVSGAQWAVLRILHSAEADGQTTMRLADLGGKLLVRPPSVTNVVERLRVAGLVNREASTTDHRAKRVRLTNAGRTLVGRIHAGHGLQIAAVMAGLDPAEQAAFRELAGKLNRHLERLAPHEARTDNDGGEAGAEAAGEAED